MRNLLPELGKETHRWSGQVLDTIDYASFTGVNPGNERLCACRRFRARHHAWRNGGLLISDLISNG